jgi:hypothetical protein
LARQSVPNPSGFSTATARLRSAAASINSEAARRARLLLAVHMAQVLQLRWAEPELARPYRIPIRSQWGLALLFLPPTSLTVLLLAFVSRAFIVYAVHFD